MTQVIAQFDPGTATPGDISTGQHGEYGLYVTNESIYGIEFTFLDGSRRICPPYQGKPYHICVLGDTFKWAIAYQFPLPPALAPFNLVVIEAFAQSELKDLPTVPVDLSRLNYIGNSVPVSTSASSVINDNNPVGTVVVEATPGGASQLLFYNDGSGVFGGGLIQFSSAGIFTSLPNHAIPNNGLQDFLGTGIALGTSNTEKIGYTLGGGTSADVGILSSAHAATLSGTAWYAKTNNYWNGVSNIAVANGYASQFYVEDATGPHFIQATGCIAGNPVAFSPSVPVMLGNSAGGGISGNTQWVGTVNPLAQMAEGDTWIEA